MAQKKETSFAVEKNVSIMETTVKSVPVAEPAALGLIGLAVAALVLASADLQLEENIPSKS
jgi:succinate-acetate transporter protein